MHRNRTVLMLTVKTYCPAIANVHETLKHGNAIAVQLICDGRESSCEEVIVVVQCVTQLYKLLGCFWWVSYRSVQLHLAPQKRVHV